MFIEKTHTRKRQQTKKRKRAIGHLLKLPSVITPELKNKEMFQFFFARIIHSQIQGRCLVK